MHTIGRDDASTSTTAIALCLTAPVPWFGRRYPHRDQPLRPLPRRANHGLGPVRRALQLLPARRLDAPAFEASRLFGGAEYLSTHSAW